MAWNNVSKPSVIGYTNVNPRGKEEYDQADIAYDDSNSYYDGVNPNQWTDVSKPVSSVWSKVNKPT